MDDRTTDPPAAKAPQLVTFDALLPDAMAARAEETGVRKAATDPLTLLALSVLAGAFIAFGAIFATTVSAGGAGLPYGVMRLLSGLVFSVGLILVIVGGAEVFTGNNMIVMAWANGKVSTGALLFNWAVAFIGNSAGACLTAGLMFYTTQYTFGGGSVGLAALSTAEAKAALDFVPALALGIMCNVLVCLAVWMCYGARTTVDKVVVIVPPITAFVAAGFEHSIANIYFIPMGLFIKSGAPDPFWASIGMIIGGSVMVAAVYWFIYLRKT
jgi:formate transporter